MVFSSAVFLFIFLPLVVFLHLVADRIFEKSAFIKNALLIVASLIFYAWGEPIYVLLLIASVFFNYLMGRLISNKRNMGKPLLIFAIIVNISMLVVYKYAGFLVGIFNVLPFFDLPVPDIRMPIGISFFTFQALSYVVDIYRDKDKKGDGFFEVMLYISLFPQLVAGPIVKYNSISEQLHDRKVSLDGMSEGVRIFIIGLSKKMLIANLMAVAADKIFALSIGDMDTFAAWTGAVTYSLQIYFDFSGYSDMAVGMGKMFGFEFPENFNYPYVAVSIRDFWKRWHISLTSWFREYLYFPLGGNRKGERRTLFNRFFVFVCTGIWHGANMTFIVWGIYHGLFMIAETLIEKRMAVASNGDKALEGRGSIKSGEDTEKHSMNEGNPKNAMERKTENKVFLGNTHGFGRFLSHIYTLLVVVTGFVIFRADNMKQAVNVIGNMLVFNTTEIGSMTASSVFSPLFIVILLIAILAATPFVKDTGNRLMQQNVVWVERVAKLVTLVLYILCIFEIAAGSYNPFIYFRF